VNIEQKEITQCVRELTVTIDAERAREDYMTVLRSLRPLAVVPGFRKGKAPLPMIENLYSEHAHEEFYRQKLQTYFDEAVAEIEPKPLTAPEVSDVNWEKGQTLTATYVYEIKPELGEIAWRGLEIPFAPQTLGEDAVDAAIEDIRKKMGKLEAVAEAAQTGDHVTLALQLPRETGEFSEPFSREIVVGENQFSAAFNELLVGKKAEDAFEAALFEPESEDADPLPPARVTVKAVKRLFLPELDDEFAKDVEYESMAEMRIKVREELEKNLAQENTRAEKEAVTDALIAANPFDAPPSIVHQVAHNMADEFAKQYQIPAERIMPAYEKIAERDLKHYYIIEAMKQSEQQDVTDEDMDSMVEELAGNMSMTAEEYRDKYAKFIESDDFAEAVKEHKLYVLIRESASFVQPKPAEATE